MLRLQENHIEFMTYLLLMKWIQNASSETKVKGWNRIKLHNPKRKIPDKIKGTKNNLRVR